MKIDGVRLCVCFFFIWLANWTIFSRLETRDVTTWHNVRSDPPTLYQTSRQELSFHNFVLLHLLCLSAVFYFYYWERKHDGRKKIGRRIALLACSSVRFAAQREKWEGPHNRALSPTCPFCPRLPCWAYLCLFVCLSNAWKHTFARQIFPLWEKRFFLFSFLFPRRFSQTCRVFFGCAVSPCPYTSASARLFSHQTKKIRNFYFSPWRKAAGRAATPVKRIGSMIHSPRGVNIP